MPRWLCYVAKVKNKKISGLEILKFLPDLRLQMIPFFFFMILLILATER